MKKLKNYIYILFVIVFAGMVVSCNDFLEREPLDGFTDDKYWKNGEAGLRTYAWGFYDEFIAYGNAGGTTADFYFPAAGATPRMSDDQLGNSFQQFEKNASATNSDWKDWYECVRRANVMLDRIPNVEGVDVAASEHWQGVARLFRAFSYYRLVQRFGDVPYVETSEVPLDQKASENLVPRTNRKLVMDKVKTDLEFAVSKIKDNDKDSGNNSINKHAAYALMARICLYEGTYRKYHGLGDETEFLKAAKNAALEIITSGKYSLGAFKSVYNSEGLSGSKEMILYKEYTNGVLANSIQAYTNTSTIIHGLTKAAVESFVCSDGLPIHQSGSEYAGDRSIEDILSNRDLRLSAIMEPAGLAFDTIMLSNSRKASTGYVVGLYNNDGPDITTIGNNTVDAPILPYNEVLLNYAEACAELGDISQNDLDISINLLRDRAGIARLTYVNENTVQVKGVTIDDPKRTSDLEKISGEVTPIIWEIRRERRVELMTWITMRFNDLRRWKKGDYLDYDKNIDGARGIYVDISKFNDAAKKRILLDGDGYLIPHKSTDKAGVHTILKRVFDPQKNYLEAVPTDQKALYDNAGIDFPQNPGW